MRRCTMTWEGTKNRWRKMFKGATYTVSCKELGTPATKEDSYRAANQWWQRKHAELQGYRPTNPLDKIIDIHRYWQDWATTNQMPGIADSEENLIDLLQRIDLPQDIARRMAEAMERTMNEPEKVETVETDETGETIGSCVTHWLGTLRSRVEFKKLSPHRYSSYDNIMARFRRWAGEDTPITKLNEKMFAMYYLNLGESYQSDATRNTHLTTINTFIKHVYSRRLIELPRNLSSPGYRFSIAAQTITTFTIEQISQLLEKAECQPKLHILLGLNCGMGAGDIAALSQDDVEWTTGVITRKRSKTRKHKNTPTVSYRLWTPTLALLREFNSGENPVLQTKTGGAWAGSEMTDGVFHKTNQLAHAFGRIMNACGIAGLSHYNLRKTSATLLETHETYGRLVTHFLGHAPQSMASKHYAAPSPELFDKAIAWLGDQYGLTQG